MKVVFTVGFNGSVKAEEEFEIIEKIWNEIPYEEKIEEVKEWASEALEYGFIEK